MVIAFIDLREANIKRIPKFKNRLGELSHTKEDGSDWSLNDWYTALSGEVGELGNLLKKLRRGDFKLEDRKYDIADEIADIMIYLDILAYQLDIDLAEAVKSKFNSVSDAQDISVWIEE